MQQQQIPVYLFTGFLEAGKTSLLRETMQDPDFNSGEPTLILLCEEGVEECEPESFAHGAKGVSVKVIDDPAALTPAQLLKWQKSLKFRRVLVECNGMWMIDDIYRALPDGFRVYQEIMVADARTALTYNANMRTLMVDKLQGCEMVIFNRCTPDFDKMALHKMVRGVSRSANISYEYENGEIEYDDIEDPLPFDVTAPVVEIEDRDFALFYRDLAEDTQKYDGLTLRYRAMAVRDEEMDASTFAAGRKVMTCCVDDIAFRGFLCIAEGDVGIKTGDWVILKGVLKVEDHRFYRAPGPVLHVTDIEKTTAPEEEVTFFY